ncbi:MULTISPECIES: HNH endonuclease signature motif containing protein [Hyphomicrobiales]|nr:MULTISPECIES: HNH endonuclease signature motif containing protein [Hyphomicrobiales]MCO5078975.1 HNH endonuclease [Chelatococcus sp.]
MCCQPGCTARATEVDHVISVRQRPDLRLSWSNLRPFCKPHHSARTAREQAFGRGTR